VLRCAEFANIEAAINAYLQRAGWGPIRRAAVAIANPVDGDHIRMTNHDWEFSIEMVRRTLGMERFIVVNDFAALARSIPYLAATDTVQVGDGQAVPGAPIGLLGAGTGLGAAALVQSGTGPIAIPSQGGHVTFSPGNERELAVLRFAWREHHPVSAELLMAGPGIELIYRALADLQGVAAEAIPIARIAERAQSGTDPLCVDTLNCFCEMLGTFSGNLALTLGARGGIYIGGGVVPRLGQFFLRSQFRARFEDTGKMRDYVASIPVHVITAPYPAFLGVSAMLDEALQ